MEQRFPVQTLHKYPHMLPEDRKLWERFLESDTSEFSQVQYDLHVGPSGYDPKATDRQIYDLAQSLSRHRIDAVLHGPQTIYIIEIKPDAGLDAFGQAFGYAWLYRQENNPPNFIQPVILTNLLKPGLADLCSAYSVAVWLVPDPA